MKKKLLHCVQYVRMNVCACTYFECDFEPFTFFDCLFDLTILISVFAIVTTFHFTRVSNTVICFKPLSYFLCIYVM